MKKMILVLALCLSMSCAENKTPDLTADKEELSRKMTEIFNDTTITPEESFAKFGALLKETYSKHTNDSLGLEIFPRIAVTVCTPEEAVALYDDAGKLIREDKVVKKVMETVRKKARPTNQ